MLAEYAYVHTHPLHHHYIIIYAQTHTHTHSHTHALSHTHPHTHTHTLTHSPVLLEDLVLHVHHSVQLIPIQMQKEFSHKEQTDERSMQLMYLLSSLSFGSKVSSRPRWPLQSLKEYSLILLHVAITCGQHKAVHYAEYAKWKYVSTAQYSITITQ